MVVLYQLTAYLYQVLSPIQRFQSMRRLKASPERELSVTGWLMLLGWALIGLLIILFFIVRRIRLERDRLSTESRFREFCDTCRLTIQEREILSAISRRVHLKKKDDIFKDRLAFDAGFTRLIQESFSAGHNVRQRKQINMIVQCIKAKLGFQKSSPTSDGAVQAPRKMSSRQIPEGRDVRVEVISESSVFCFDAKVIRNDSYELVLHPDTPVEVVPGLTAQVQYKVGAMTWVFELTVLACGSGGLELNHNDHSKYINRRRFARVAVQKKAKVAVFDMNQNICGDIRTPTFVDAVVTEISGPGLQIQMDLELKMFDRILVVFEPEQGKVVQDVAEVRGFRRTDSASLVAVEMIGLNEGVVNDLIRITNHIARTAGTLLSCPENEEQPGHSNEEQMAGITRQKEQPV